MVDVNWSLIVVQALAFIITFLIVKRLAWLPILKIIADRQTDIRGSYEKAESAQREMEDLRKHYEQRLLVVEQEQRSRINAAMQKGQEEADKLVEQAQKDARQLVERAHSEVEREREKVLAELRGQVAHLSVAIAGRIIDEHLDEQKHRALVDDFINRIGSLA